MYQKLNDQFSVTSTSMYMATYRNIIHLIPETNLDPDNVSQALHPPNLKRLLGRPKATRFKAEGEPTNRRRSSTMRCSNCDIRVLVRSVSVEPTWPYLCLCSC
ncbi:hypothetical protein CFOL_v3_06591 [Cephalotus follicularis]|uniref:Uncharacterized protein n=1 Tax=Cephalotus follicularis TaxID=3775 RepID=A0A1Q3B563_CEPFO|nr:hypothetical protein CFOL_v3_06591 [Cephalotus follicularis]